MRAKTKNRKDVDNSSHDQISKILNINDSSNLPTMFFLVIKTSRAVFITSG